MLRRIAITMIAIVTTVLTTIVSAPAAQAIPTYTHTTTNSGEFHRTKDRAPYYSIRVRVSGEIPGKAALYLDGDLQRVRHLRDGVIVFHVYRSELRDGHHVTLTVKIFPREDRRRDRTIRRGVTDRPEGGAIVALARGQVGDRYARGGSGPSRWDCSGLVAYAVESVTGRNLPRTSGDIRAAGRRVSSQQPGDVVWTSGHVSIYAGHGKVVEAANPRTGVTYRDMWQRHPTYIRF